MILYRILQAIDGAALAVLLWFFAAGLTDGSIDSFNMGLWLVLLAVPIGLLMLAHAAQGRGRRGIACLLLAIVAAPALLYAGFVLLIVILQPDFR